MERERPSQYPTRRAFLSGAGKLSAGIIVLEGLRQEALAQERLPLFADPDAQEYARNNGIHAGNFFVPPDIHSDYWSQFDTLTTVNKLLPLYPPAIMAYANQITVVANEYKLPPNVLATICSIESAGDEKAISSTGAIGLAQVQDWNFPPELQYKYDPSYKGTGVDKYLHARKIDSFPEYTRKTREKENPYTNLRAAAKVLDSARNYLLDHQDEDHRYTSGRDSRLWHNVAMAYNGGLGAVTGDNTPTETIQYGEHFLRFVQAGQVAGYLRDLGKSDSSIVYGLRSQEVDARAFSLQQKRQRAIRDGKPFDRFKAINLYKGTTTASLSFEDWNTYKYYIDGKTKFDFPYGPHLRVWATLGGQRLLDRVVSNRNPRTWLPSKT